MNFRFFGMEALETFVCFDVMKNADIENDFKRLGDHINKNFSSLEIEVVTVLCAQNTLIC